jgi:uncharacterized protein YcbK (DUF882 family)
VRQHELERPRTRRSVLKLGAFAAVAVAAAPRSVLAALPREHERSLSFEHLHTGERLKTVYWERGRYIPSALDDVNHVLRDFRTGDVIGIDPHLLDVLYQMRRTLDTREPVQVIGGYRSPETNAMLAARSHGVSRNSLHMKGKAIDLRLPGRRLSAVRRTAMSLHRGGVGYYPASNFVHVDTGRVRYW